MANGKYLAASARSPATGAWVPGEKDTGPHWPNGPPVLTLFYPFPPIKAMLPTRPLKTNWNEVQVWQVTS